MKNKTIFGACLIALASTAASAQTADEQLSLNTLLPPTPQAAAFARYGEYPVSYATGIPQISIPLYEIKLGAYTLPISISYHASGIKADDVASTVGLGWVLNAGGVISRSVQGAPDLRHKSVMAEDTAYYSYENVRKFVRRVLFPCENYGQEETGILTPPGEAELKDMAYNPLEANCDTESDRYSYNFNGKCGIFAYSHEEGKFVTLNYAPIRIQATVWQDDPKSRSNYFTIQDSDGYTYYFDAVEETGPSDDENQAMATSWYLTQVNTPYGIITFEYEQATDYHVYSVSETLWVGSLYDAGKIEEGQADYNGSKHFRSSINRLYRTLLLKSIQWNGNRIDFTYAHDRQDIWPDRLVEMVVKGCDGTACKKVVFDNKDYLGNSGANRRMLLRSLSISDEGTYSFAYDRSRHLPDYLLRDDANPIGVPCKTDYWGYSNGNASDYFAPLEVVNAAINGYALKNGTITDLRSKAANRTPNINYGKAGMLTQITYPTGGYTSFTYEQNLKSLGIPVGGLRIRKIANCDNMGNIQTKTYAYSKPVSLQDPPEELMSYDAYHWYDKPGGVSSIRGHVNCVSNPVFPLSGSSTPVYYAEVTETFPDGSRIEYTYEDFQSKGIDEFHLGDSNFKHPSQTLAALHDRGAFDPLLLRKDFVDKNGNVVRSESYHYEGRELKSFEMGTRLVSTLTCDNSLNFILNEIPRPLDDTYMLHRKVTGYSHRYQLVEKSVTEDGVTTTESYEYDEFLRTLAPQAVTVSGSDGVPYRTEYEYPFERLDDPICKRMEEEYLIHDEVVGVVEYGGGQELSRKRVDYQFIDANKDFYPWKVRESLAGAGLRETARYEDYDKRGNPRTIVTDNKDATALLWSYNSQYPVAKVEGCTYPQLLQLAGDAVSGLGGKTNTPDIQASLEAIRNAIGGKYPVTTYLYRPLTGPSSIVDEYGHETSYDYHGGSGKLAAVRDASGTLRRFDYNYVKPFNPIQP